MKAEDKLGCLFLIMIVPISSIINGFVLTKLWTWFVLSTFEAAPALTIPQAIGIAMLVSFLAKDPRPRAEDKSKSTGEMIVEVLGLSIVAPAIVLFCGFIISLFI